MRDTAGSHERSMVQSQSWRSADVGKTPGSTAILRKSQFSWPGKRKQQVTPLMAADTKWFRSPYVGVVSFNVRKQISYNASLSNKKDSSEFSTSWWKLKTALEWVQHCPNDIVPSLDDGETTNTLSLWLCHKQIILSKDALYGSTTVSDTFGEGMTEKVSIMPQLFEVHEQCHQGMFGSWKLNLAKGTEKNWENIYKTYCKWDAVWIFLTHFGDQQCAHSSASAATERMAKLEALQTSLFELLNQKERPLSLHLNRTQYWRRKESLKQLFGKVAATTILFKTSISRIPLLLFGQHQVPSQLTQHLRCSDPDRFFKSNSWKIIQNCNHEHHLAFAQLLPAPARQFKQQNPIIWQFNLATSDIWKDYDGSGNESDGQTDCKIRGAKKCPIKTLCRTTSRHQPVCPKTKLSGRNNWPNGPARTLSMVPARESNLIPASTVLKSEVRGLTSLKPVFGKNQ